MFDKNTGVLIQEDGCKGDSPHRTGILLVYLYLLGHTEKYKEISINALNTFKTSEGWTRGGVGDKSDFIYDPKHFSRDQASRLFLGLACLGHGPGFEESKQYYIQCLKRSGTHQNGDLLGFGEIAFILRLFFSKSVFLFPVIYLALTILDIRFVGDAFSIFRKKWDGSSLTVPDLCYALSSRYQTPFLFLAEFLFIKNPDIEREMLANHGDKDMEFFGYEVSTNGCHELIPATKYFFNFLRRGVFDFYDV